MKYKLPVQKIDLKLNKLYLKKIKEHKVYVPSASKNNLKELGVILSTIKEKGLPDHLVIKKLKGKLGHGIFLHPEAEPILRGEVIAPYSGEVYLSQQNNAKDSDYCFALISDLKLSREEQKELDPGAKYHPGRLYSIDLDAEKMGNFTRFINHSGKPNVKAELLKIPGKFLGTEQAAFELVYFAKKDILPGEQLLVSYEAEDESYWGALKIVPFPMTPRTFRINLDLEFYTK